VSPGRGFQGIRQRFSTKWAMWRRFEQRNIQEGLNLAKVKKRQSSHLPAGLAALRCFAGKPFDWIMTSPGRSSQTVDGLADGQDGCTSIGYSESWSQQPRKRTLFGHLLFGYQNWPCSKRGLSVADCNRKWPGLQSAC
jgi:hypothetical protein